MLTQEQPRAATIEREFPKITREGLDDLRKRIGVKIGVTAEPWCYEATRDNIRHYAHGIGDDNPLWCDPSYARGTAYGDVIAPPSFVFALNRILSGYVGGLPGIHAMWAGADLTWHRPIVRNATLTTDPSRIATPEPRMTPASISRPRVEERSRASSVTAPPAGPPGGRGWCAARRCASAGWRAPGRASAGHVPRG